MQDNEKLFSQVAAPQEAVMDAMLIKHLSRLCRQQAEQMSANMSSKLGELMTKAFFDLRKNYGFKWNLTLKHVFCCLLNYEKIKEFGAIFFQNHSRREKSKTWASLGTFFLCVAIQHNVM